MWIGVFRELQIKTLIIDHLCLWLVEAVFIGMFSCSVINPVARYEIIAALTPIISCHGWQPIFFFFIPRKHQLLLNFMSRRCILYSLDEENLKCVLGNSDPCFFGRARKSKMLYFYFWRRDSRYLFVSDSWYYQIQTSIYIKHILSKRELI